MPFGTLTLGSESFEPSRPGVYPKAGSSISLPTNEIRFTPASRSTKAKKASIAVTNIEHQDFTPAGSSVPQREEAIVTLNIQTSTTGAFTEAELVVMIQRIQLACTADRIRRMLNGES